MALERPRRPFSVAEYHRMGESGVLGNQDRLELIHGDVLMMSPIGPRHVFYVNRLNDVLVPLVGQKGQVSVQNPVQVEETSEPQPDVVVIRRRHEQYLTRLPVNEDVLLAIEVADSSLDYDREVKLPLYSAAGIPESWILDVNVPLVERHTEPGPHGYRKRELLRSGDVATLVAIPDCTVEIAAILG
jgi:Uma2 family endonuclease